MSYRNAIPYIAPGSLWEGPNGRPIRVIQAAAHHVAIDTGESTEVLWEAAFRYIFRPLYDREKIRSQFTMSLANLGAFRVFWLPKLRRIMVRSISCERQFRVPEEAQLVGTFAAPCRTEDFFEALDELIAGPRVEQKGRVQA